MEQPHMRFRQGLPDLETKSFELVGKLFGAERVRYPC